MINRKLVFVIHDREKFLGGPIINLIRVIPRLIDKGYEVHLLSFYTDGTPNSEYFESIGVKVYKHSISIQLDDQVSWVLETMEAIQPDIFFADVSIASCIAGKWLIKSGISVINYHRSDDEYNWGKALFFSNANSEYALSGIICVSRFLFHKLADKLPESIPSWVMPSGVPISRYIAQHENNEFRIVYAGRLFNKQKQVVKMVRQFIDLCKKYPEIKVSIFGDGPDKKECEELIIKADLVDRIKITDHLYGDEYQRELSKHNVSVLLSDYEGTPGSVMDAMSCGLVPVVLRYNGIDELIDHGKSGLIVEDREESFHESISSLMFNRVLLKELSANARNHIIANFSVDQAVGKLVNIIEGLNPKGGRKKFLAPLEVQMPEHFMDKEKASGTN